MSANYRKLGDIVELIDERNKDGKVQNLIGVSIDKCFIKSVANTIGTDLTKYQVIKKNDFACSLMQVSRDGKIPIACLKDYDEAIMSPAYYIFRIKNTNEVLPDYLAMWFMRTEFDREASYIAVGGVRGSMPWEDFCDMKLPVPDLKEQEKIVNTYNAITKRIQLKQKINENLEKTAQCIYKKMFVEDADEKWETKQLGDIINCFDSQRIPLSEEERANIKGFFPYYGAMSIVDYINSYIFDGDYILFSEDGINVVDEQGHPALQFLHGKFWLNNHAHILQGNDIISNELLYLQLKNTNVRHLVTGAAQPKINQKNMNSIELIIADKITTVEINKIIKPLFNYISFNEKEIAKLQDLKQIVISRISGM